MIAQYNAEELSVGGEILQDVLHTHWHNLHVVSYRLLLIPRIVLPWKCLDSPRVVSPACSPVMSCHLQKQFEDILFSWKIVLCMFYISFNKPLQTDGLIAVGNWYSRARARALDLDLARLQLLDDSWRIHLALREKNQSRLTRAFQNQCVFIFNSRELA